MHAQTVTGFGAKHLWNRVLAGLLAGCLVLGVSAVGQADEPAPVERPDSTAESPLPGAGESAIVAPSSAQGSPEGRSSTRLVTGGLGTVLFMLGTGLGGAGIYLAANKGKIPGVSSDVTALSKTVFLPVGAAFLAGGLVMIGVAARHKTR